MIKRTAILLLVLAAGACSRTPAPEVGELRVIPLGGAVRLVDGGETTLLEEATTVGAGVSILTETGGRAQIELPGERSMELAPDTELRVDDQVSEVANGSVLVRTSSPMMLRAGGAEIEASAGIFRIDRGLSVTVATYSGAATVLGSGVPPISALRQADVLQGGEIPLGVQALQVRRNDPWDAELLGRAIDLGLRLLDYERGLTRQLPSGRDADAVSRVLEPAFSSRAIRSAISELGNAARAVVAAVVAEEAARLDGGSPPRILSEIVGLIHQLGANWIVVVEELGLPAAAAALTDKLGDFATSFAELFAPPPAPNLTTTTQGPVAPRDTGPSGDDNPGGGGSNPPGGGGTGNGGTTQPPDPPPSEEAPPNEGAPTAQCGSTVECTVEDILDTPGTP